MGNSNGPLLDSQPSPSLKRMRRMRRIADLEAKRDALRSEAYRCRQRAGRVPVGRRERLRKQITRLERLATAAQEIIQGRMG